MSDAERDRKFRVYIIEINSGWYQLVANRLPAGKRCYYVGETGRAVEERFREHRTGTVRPGDAATKSVAPFSVMLSDNGGKPLSRKQDILLRRTLMARYPPQRSRDEVRELERLVIDELRAAGNCVYPTDRRRPHRFEFEDYMQEVDE